MMWDGLGFFGTSDTKLERIRGKKVNWCTPFLSWKSTPLGLIALSVMTYIIVTEAYNLGN